MPPRSAIKHRIKLEQFDEDTNRLMIESVRVRPVLWDHNRQNIPGIKRAQERQQSEVAAALNCSVELFKKKWKNLKSCFYRQIRKIPLSSDQKYMANPNTFPTDWPYYRMMLFLIDPNDIHPSVLQAGRKLKSKTIKKETKKRSIEESDAGSSVLRTESSSSDTVAVKKQRIDESDAKSSVLPLIEPSGSDSVNLTDEVDENIGLKFSQVSSSSNINYLSTGVIRNDESEPFSSNSQNEVQNQYEVDEVEVTPDIAIIAHPGVLHIIAGLSHFIDPMTDDEKIQVGAFLHGFAQNIRNGIENSSGN